MFRLTVIFLIITCLSISFSACKKDKLLTDSGAKVAFSQDSVLFDTVFTTVGSTTRNIRIINKNKQRINISSITLEKGQASQFTLNVDGMPGKSFSDVEIPANDSIYVFIQVNVNPTSQNSPLVINDKIITVVNGNQQSVALEAWGQDAYYHYPTSAIQFQNGYLPFSTLSSATNTTITWNNDKPHVIYGWLVVDSTQTLVINQGVRVYLHQNAGLWVYRFGTLQVNGVLGQEVTFQGDRRESDFADLPGQWDRIWINEGSPNNYINYAIIKNAYIGIQASLFAGTSPLPPRRVKITNTIVRNSSKWGLYAMAFNVFGGNDVIANSQEYNAVFTMGGTYKFINTTFANYWTQPGGRSGQACLHIDNYQTLSSGATDVLPLDSAHFYNCIIDGNQGNEMELDLKPSGGLPLAWNFSYCLLKTTMNISNSANFDNCRGGNTIYQNPAGYDFSLQTGSSAINMGPAAVGIYSVFPTFLTDIKNNSRSDGSPDAGAYEK